MEAAAKEPVLGLRERKKLQTRELIAETARRLFSERGFEDVTVAEIARVADLSEQTVFNYFPRKEDLVYWRFGSFEGQMLDAVRERADGDSVLAAFRRFMLAQRGLLARFDPESRDRFVAMSRMISESPALLIREREILLEVTDSLAALIAEEQQADRGGIEPWVAANAMIGVHRQLIALTRRGVLEGVEQRLLARRVKAQAERAFELLERGLAEFAPGGASR